MSDSIPKAVVFDIGGVVLGSPFKAIIDFEKSHDIPAGYINFAISAAAPAGAWQRLEKGEISLGPSFFKEFKANLEDSTTWASFLAWRQTKAPTGHPRVDAEQLFWNMMMASRDVDPHIYPAVQRLKRSGQFIVVALSNTVHFPPNHQLARDVHNLRGENGRKGLFDIFVSSAHVGIRKPEPAIYDLAMGRIQAVARERLGRDILEKEVIFLDDIGANLRPARSRGWETVKVNLGQGREAVLELEKRTRMSLLPYDTSKL